MRSWFAWFIYHRAEWACRVLADGGSTGFVRVLRRRIEDVELEFPIEGSGMAAADFFYETQKDAKNVNKANV